MNRLAALALGILIGYGGADVSHAVEAPDPVPLVLQGKGDPVHVPVPEPAVGIGPGSQLQTRWSIHDGWSRCSANFIWRGSDDTLYLGTAGHCVIPANMEWPGTIPESDVGLVSVLYADCTAYLCTPQWTPLGPVVYAVNRGIGEDFALVEIPDDLTSQLRSRLPIWGGPSGEALVRLQDTFLHFGQGSPIHALQRGTYQTLLTRGRAGMGLEGDTASFVAVHSATYGDSGSGAVRGRRLPDLHPLAGAEAVGVITHALGPGLLAFGTTTFRARTLAASRAGLNVSLVREGEFDPS